jgi:membrane protein
MEALGRIRDGARAMSARETFVEAAGIFREHRLLIQASAIAFRALLALIPLLLFLVGLLGFLNFEEVWQSDLAPDVRDAVSPAAFKLINDAITAVLEEKAFFWVTIGAVIVVLEGSSIARAAVRVLNAIYGVEEERSDVRRFLISGLVAAGVTALLVAAIAARAVCGAIAPDGFAGILVNAFGWLVCLLALVAAIGLLVRSAPDVDRPFHWVSFGAVLVAVAWIAMSLLFWLYVTQIASYESIFGHLATVFIGLEYLYLSATVFIGGLVVDSLVEEHAPGGREGKRGGT